MTSPVGITFDLTRMPHLHADQAGYMFHGQRIDGFDDRTDLDYRARYRIASWAKDFHQQLSPEQQRLLASPIPDNPLDQELLYAASQNIDQDLPQAARFGLYDLLNDQELLLMREPWQQLANPRREYPLAVGELAKLTAVSEKQVREWEKAGLLPGYRIGGRRHFFSAAVVHAFALKRLNRPQIAALASMRAAPESPFTKLIRHALATA